MTIEKKLLGTNPASGDKANIEDVFSTYLYTGTGSTQTINNGIDLDGEGGMVWIKGRTAARNHMVLDTERGATKYLQTDSDNQEGNAAGGSFQTTGFELSSGHDENQSGDFASWTFRKRERFFDVVTYTGNGSGQTIAHSLGVAPGMIWVKQLDTSGRDWMVFHRSATHSSGSYASNNLYSKLNTTMGFSTTDHWGDTDPTDEVFTLGDKQGSNGSGKSYVAYLFAHDPDGEDDDGMIACGSYTTDGSASAQSLNLGWEPQFLIVKKSSGSNNWEMYDTTREWTAPNDTYGVSSSKRLYANLSVAEGSSTSSPGPTATGMYYPDGGQSTSSTYVYMAIRAPMMKEPEAGSDVYETITRGGTGAIATITGVGFAPDLVINSHRDADRNHPIYDRLRGATKALQSNLTSAETTVSGGLTGFDNMDGFVLGNSTLINSSTKTYVDHVFKRAKGCFDVCAYTGNGTAGRTVNHSLGVVPEMMVVKARTLVEHWPTYHKSLGSTKYLWFDDIDSPQVYTGHWNNTDPTATTFTVGDSTNVNQNTKTYIAYLFATLDGVSKCGSYTGNGSNQNIACGFSAGARFVLITRTDSTTGDWYIWDTERGIVTGNDPHLSLNTTSAEVTSDDSIDPQSAGFTVNQVSATNINVSSGTYIFLAIA